MSTTPNLDPTMFMAQADTSERIQISDLDAAQLPLIPTETMFHVKVGNTDQRCFLDALLAPHADLTNNPHNVTKVQVGLGNVEDYPASVDYTENSATKYATAKSVNDAFKKNESDLNNYPHFTNYNNPHKTTKAHVGLGLVENYPPSNSYTENNPAKYATAKALFDMHQAFKPNELPRGAIIMWWSGLPIPAGYQICNGQNGTPNLIDRFPVGAGGSYGIGSTGGAATVSHSHAINVHGHALTVNEIPDHKHEFTGDDKLEWGTGGYFHVVQKNVWDITATRGDGRASPKVLTNNLWGSDNRQYSGGAAHAHGASSGSATLDNRPPYIGIYFIMKMV